MGQITQATIDMIEGHAARGEHPPLTVWEVEQLAHAWKTLHAVAALPTYRPVWLQFGATMHRDVTPNEAGWLRRSDVLDFTPSAPVGDGEQSATTLEDERERLCRAIRDEDNYCVEQGDYMLDSNDCIKIIRGNWVRPEYSIDAARAAQAKGGAA